jgi:hypothetical protein
LPSPPVEAPHHFERQVDAGLDAGGGDQCRQFCAA